MLSIQDGRVNEGNGSIRPNSILAQGPFTPRPFSLEVGSVSPILGFHPIFIKEDYGLTLYHTIPTFNDPEKEALENFVCYKYCFVHVK